MLEDLYRDTILKHYQSPSHRGRLADADAEAFNMNPLCGDEMRITARIEDGSIADVAFEARGCSVARGCWWALRWRSRSGRLCSA